MTTVTVDELKRAWSAVGSGRFRTADPIGALAAGTWAPTERVITVLGVGGRVGATTVALAIAESSVRSARVVEVGTPRPSGLAAAASAELGADDTGWRHGTRDRVRVERSAVRLNHPGHCPLPASSPVELTVVDAGWDPAQIHQVDHWLSDTLLNTEVVLVAAPTVPGMRALEVAFGDLYEPTNCWVAVVGQPQKKWAKRVQLAAPTPLEHIAAEGRLVCVPPDRTLAVEGIISAPMPTAVLTACQPITGQLVVHQEGIHHVAAY